MLGDLVLGRFGFFAMVSSGLINLILDSENIDFIG